MAASRALGVSETVAEAVGVEAGSGSGSGALGTPAGDTLVSVVADDVVVAALVDADRSRSAKAPPMTIATKATTPPLASAMVGNGVRLRGGVERGSSSTVAYTPGEVSARCARP